MGSDSRLLSDRLALFLRQRVNAKTLAREIGCDQRTASNILSGTWPGARHWLGIVRAFGHDVTEAVFHPQAAIERLEREARRLEAELQEARARAAVDQGFAPGSAGRVAARQTRERPAK